MSQQAILSISTLPAPWKRLMRRCHVLWFGELIDCRVQQGNITNVERFVKSILTKPPADIPCFCEANPIPYAWQTVIDACRRNTIQTIPFIKIESGEPVRFCINEGQWTSEIK